MADAGFNGTTIAIGIANQAPLLDVNYDDSAAEVDVTGCADTTHTYEAGISNPSATFTLVGSRPATGCDVGDEGAISIVWFDGVETSAMTNGVVTKVTTSGSLDGAITCAITVRPTAA